MIKNSDKTPDWILSNENIKTIVSNLSDFVVAERKLSSVRSLLRDYISDENPLPYADHRYHPTRSKVKDPKDHVSYFGQASTSVTGNKGSRKRTISDEQIFQLQNRYDFQIPPDLPCQIRNPCHMKKDS